ncbi:MAG: hypothetical protein KDA81_07720 [Planctomycetaceae bacterium]|nr:hypothetical protein [Planctomycetaceae bacterium]
MRHADFRSPAARLADAMKQLEAAWMNTKEEWADPVSQHVEDEYLVPLHGQVRAMLDTVEKLAEVMGRAERACSHRREQGPIL